ncbi:hypothetical protein VTJ83DRAFT_2480 [Remersonia thermophila]|uniref:Conserved oligomeric Golgi complex subunit 1 n=1 Tax=Remersonia thermophila TaxID=72144 RepID=A0ABR4DJ23_9PEZI
MATLPPNLDLASIPSSASLFSTAAPDPSSSSSAASPAPGPAKLTKHHQHPAHAHAPHGPYTLPQIRAIHGALHARIADVSAALRTRVGTSYRELLGTADAIVAMRDDLDAELLPTLGRMGARCGAGVVAAKAKGLRTFAGSGRYGPVASCSVAGLDVGLGEAARRALLEAVLLALRQVLGREELRKAEGRGNRLVLAARLYVLGRLLVKSLESKENGKGKGQDGPIVTTTTTTPTAATAATAAVETARRSLETAHRGRLMRAIDAVLRSGSDKAMSRGDVLGALAAYSLATSSGARDVLAHFLQVRAQAISLALEADDNDDDDDGDDDDDDDDNDGNASRAGGPARNPRDVLRALGLYAKTLVDVQTLVPHRLGEALAALKEKRLLESPSLRDMEGLRLDVYGRWCGDEIQFYTPFIRHDDLDGPYAREKLSSWAERGGEVLLRGLEATLQGMVELKAIVELRTSVLRLWIAEGGKARGFDPSELLDRLRGATQKHMLRVVEAKVAKLRLVGSEVAATLDAWREDVTDRRLGLWDVASLDTDLLHGAARFTHDVVLRLHGRSDAVAKAVASYASWFRVVDDVGQVADQLRRQRWDVDADEIEDEDALEERQRLLSKDDPQALAERLSRLLVDAFARLDEQLTRLWEARRQGPNRGAIAMYLARLLRDVRARLPDVEAVRGFGLQVVPELHEAVAETVAVAPLDELATEVLPRKTVVGRALWEGDPPLPGSPSAGMFRFLRSLATAMADAGGDLWSPAAVGVLKQRIGRQVGEVWLAAVGALEGEEEATKPATGSRESSPAEGEGENENEAKTGGDEEAAEKGSEKQEVAGAASSEQHRDLLIQWLMDIYYLRSFLGPHQDSLKELEESVGERSGLDAAAKARMVEASQGYFKRTSLLFGLLVT